MEFIAMETWPVIQNVLGLILCTLLIGHLFQGRATKRHAPEAGQDEPADGEFRQEVQTRLVRQCYEQAVEKIRATVSSELTSLLHMTGALVSDLAATPSDATRHPRPGHRGLENTDPPNLTEMPAGEPIDSHPYETVKRLAGMGWDVKRIAATTKLGRGEIDLLMALHKKSSSPG